MLHIDGRPDRSDAAHLDLIDGRQLAPGEATIANDGETSARRISTQSETTGPPFDEAAARQWFAAECAASRKPTVRASANVLGWSSATAGRLTRKLAAEGTCRRETSGETVAPQGARGSSVQCDVRNARSRKVRFGRKGEVCLLSPNNRSRA
jgi:hypothetical protein